LRLTGSPVQREDLRPTCGLIRKLSACRSSACPDLELMDVVRVAGEGAKSRRRRGTWRSRSLQLHRPIQQLSFDHRPPPHLLARSLLYNLHLDLPNLQLSSSSPLALMPLPLLSGPPPRKSTDTCRRCSKKFNLFSNRARTCGHCGFSYCQEVSSDMLLYSGGIEEEMVNELEADDEPDSPSSQHCDHRALTPRRPDSFSIRGGGGSGGSGYEEEHCCDFCISFVKSERKEEKENELNSPSSLVLLPFLLCLQLRRSSTSSSLPCPSRSSRHISQPTTSTSRKFCTLPSHLSPSRARLRVVRRDQC